MNVGKKIYDLRIAKGMTLEELGTLVGVGKSTVRKWETGAIANMRRDKIEKLAAALGCNPLDLLQDLSTSQEKIEDNSLSDDEIKLIELFRLVPDEDRKLVLGMIRAALSSKGLL